MCGQHAQTRAQEAKLDPFDMCHFISFLDFLLAAKTFKVMFGSRRSYSGLLNTALSGYLFMSFYHGQCIHVGP